MSIETTHAPSYEAGKRDGLATAIAHLRHVGYGAAAEVLEGMAPSLGGKLERKDERGPAIAEIGVHRPKIKLFEKDIELMRHAVAEHYARGTTSADAAPPTPVTHGTTSAVEDIRASLIEIRDHLGCAAGSVMWAPGPTIQRVEHLAARLDDLKKEIAEAEKGGREAGWRDAGAHYDEFKAEAEQGAFDAANRWRDEILGAIRAAGIEPEHVNVEPQDDLPRVTAAQVREALGAAEKRGHDSGRHTYRLDGYDESSRDGAAWLREVDPARSHGLADGFELGKHRGAAERAEGGAVANPFPVLDSLAKTIGAPGAPPASDSPPTVKIDGPQVGGYATEYEVTPWALVDEGCCFDVAAFTDGEFPLSESNPGEPVSFHLCGGYQVVDFGLKLLEIARAARPTFRPSQRWADTARERLSALSPPGPRLELVAHGTLRCSECGRESPERDTTAQRHEDTCSAMHTKGPAT